MSFEGVGQIDTDAELEKLQTVRVLDEDEEGDKDTTEDSEQEIGEDEEGDAYDDISSDF